MQVKPKSNSIITHQPIDGGIAFLFRGQNVGTLLFSNMNTANLQRAQTHGMVQRIGDGGAVERIDKVTGLMRTDAEMDAIKKARIVQLIEHYNSGTAEWNLTRAAATGPDTSGLTIEAISRVYGWDTGTVDSKVTKMAEKKGISRREMLGTYANIPDVATMIGTIKAERAARTGLDAQGMADELANA
jgi:hypothetical protein